MLGNQIKNRGTKSIVISMLIFLMILSPFVLRKIGLVERFSSPLSLIINLALISLCYVVEGRISKKFIFLMGVNIICLIVTMFVYGSLGAIITHLNMLLMINYFNEKKLPKSNVAFLHLATAILLILWFLSLDIGAFNNIYEQSGLLINPCTFGILTLACAYHFLASTDYILKKGYLKVVVYAVIIVIAVYYIDFSMCRASLLTLVVFVCLLPFRQTAVKNYKVFMLAFLSISILLPFIYIILFNIIGRFEILGKNLFTGRQYLWSSTIKLLSNPFNFIFGAGSGANIEYTNGVFYDEPHNMLLGIFKNVGIIAMFTVFTLFCTGKNTRKISKININSRLIFLSCIIISTFETVINGSEFYLFFLTFLLTAED